MRRNEAGKIISQKLNAVQKIVTPDWAAIEKIKDIDKQLIC
jgi:hypothetical protein